MNTLTLGTIKHHSLKKKWEKESDFSDWLVTEEGLGRLSELIGIDLCEGRREVPIGDFKADIVAQEDGGEGKVVIENQYKTVNHDHLGKLITYAAGVGAKIAILVVEEARPEAISTIKWLNEISRDDFAFYLVKAELLQIDDSALAPELSIIEAPDIIIRETRARVEEITEVKRMQLEFWISFSSHAMSDASFKKVFSRLRTPRPQHWFDLPCGSSACHIGLTLNSREDKIAAELYIDDDKDLFHQLYSEKSKIESECGFEFEWRELPEGKASRIIVSTSKRWQSPEVQKECFDWLCAKAIAIRKTIGKRL